MQQIAQRQGKNLTDLDLIDRLSESEMNKQKLVAK